MEFRRRNDLENMQTKIKTEKREEISRKKKIKRKKGGTLAGQILRAQTAKKYSGNIKKMPS